MAKSANLLLSDKELQLVSDESWIRIKENILEKVALLFAGLPPVIGDCLKLHLHDYETFCPTSPKISRGERYKGLPYLILDYPREFGKEDVFAVRTMFWWAHDFSIQLHVSGKFKKAYQENILSNIKHYGKSLYLCMNDDPWQHEVAEPNYMPVASLNPAEVAAQVSNHSFLKIACVVPLREWSRLDEKFAEGYLKICRLLG